MVFETIREFLCEQLACDESRVTPDTVMLGMAGTYGFAKSFAVFRLVLRDCHGSCGASQ